MDPFAGWSDAVDAPARKLRVLTSSDTADLPETPKALWISGAGTLRLIALGDTSAVDLGEVGSGQIVPVRAKRIMATGTTATVVGLY